MWVSRTIEGRIRTLARRHPIVAVVGPRQSGKTSLLKHLYPNIPYYSLDDPAIQATVLTDPNSILDTESPIILDEVQAAPDLFPYLKAAVDKDRRPGRFFLTGSQNLLLHARIGESLAGRAVYLPLLPFDVLEWRKHKKRFTKDGWFQFCSYPEPFLFPKKRESWLKGYIQTYIERDLHQIAEVGDLRDFTRFLRILSLRNGQMLNFSDIARDVSVAPNTVKRWISILEASFQVFLLEPYFSNRSNRIIKTPKIYFTEPWMAWELAGGLPQDPGIMLEASFVAAIYRWAAHTELRRVYYFRTKEGFEVDLVLESRQDRSQPLIAVEIKHSRTFTVSLLRGLNGFLRQIDGHVESYLVSNIQESRRMGRVTLQKPIEFFETLLNRNFRSRSVRVT
ncbi:MAG TPA: ATP-binding protein [Bdellovibrionota bacterium]|nr:ATP-binding protein [Bdellovibrionota bacterium]